MRVRCTATVYRRQASADTTGTVQHNELPADRLQWQRDEVDFVFVLHHPPTILVKIDDCDQDSGLGPDMIYVDKQLGNTFVTKVELPA